MATISTLAVNLIARTSVFERGMKRSRRGLKGFRQDTALATKRMVSFAKGLLVSGGAVFAIREFANAASRAQETMNLFNTVFAENAAATARWADDFAKNIGRSKTEVKEWAATLQDTFVPLGFARDRAAELSKSLVELAVDVGSFKNIASDREVIDSFTSAIVGNHRAVRAYGVVITNATIETAAFKAGLNKTFKELTELEKVQLRYNIIMASTKDAQGDAAKTANNYANRLKKLKGQWVDLKETIGKTILPTLNKLLGSLIKNKDAIVSVTKKLLIFTAKAVIIVGSINLVIKAVFFLVKAFKALAIARTIVLSLSGPAGWAAIAAGAALATVAIIGINEVIDGTIKKLRVLGELPIESGLSEPKTIKQLQKRIALINRAIELEKKNRKVFLVDMIPVFQKSLKLRQDQLNVLLKEKKIQEDIAATAKKRLEDQLTLMEKIKQEAENIIKNVFDKLSDLSKPEKEKETLGGRFQQIRSAFIDVAALNPAANPTTELQMLNKKTDEGNELLRELNRNSMGVFQA